MGFWFRGRTLAANDRLKMAGVLAGPPSGGGLIGLLRPTSNRSMIGGFYTPAATGGGYIIGRDTLVNTDRLTVWRPIKTPVIQGSNATGTGTSTTAAFTPPAYSTLIAWTAFRDTATVAASSCTTSGLTWTLIPGADVNVNDGTVFMRMRAFYAVIGASPASMTVATTAAAADHSGIVVAAIEGGGVDFSNVAVNTGAAGAVTATLGSNPSTNSFVLGAMHDRTFAASITPPSGYSELFFGNIGTNGKIQIALDDNISAPAVAWSQSGETLMEAIAIEIRQPALIQHSSKVWVDNQTQCVFAYSAGASEHYLGMDAASNIEKITSTVPLDAVTALALGRQDLAPARGSTVGDWYWVGVLGAMPPYGLLDRVMRQQEPPTVLKPWLAHLVPLTGRDVPQCILTGKAMTLDAGTPPVATSAVMQPQEDDDDIALGVARRLLRVRQRNATGTTELVIDAGPITEAAAVIIAPPATGGTSLGAAANGAALTTTTLPSAAPAQQGPVVVGAALVDGVPQTGTGSVALGAVVAAPTWNSGTHESLWDDAGTFLAPSVDPISLSIATGTPEDLDLQPLVEDPSRAGYTVSVLSTPAGLSVGVSGKIITSSASVEGSYQATLRISNVWGATDVSLTVDATDAATRFPANGYLWASTVELPAGGTGSWSNFLLIITEQDPIYKFKSLGGAVESAAFFDVRYETTGGTKIPHRILYADGNTGRLMVALNFARNFAATEYLNRFVGKPGLSASEEDIAGTRAGGWLAFNAGWSLTDFSGLGRPWTTNVNVNLSQTDDAFPAGGCDGTSSYLGRTCTELNGLTELTWLWWGNTPEAAGRAQEMWSLGDDTDTTIACRFTGTGVVQLSLNVGGTVQTLVSDVGYYVPGRRIGMSGRWKTGETMVAAVDGDIVEPPTTPAVLTGAVAGAATILKLGGGGRAAKPTFWNGKAGLLFLCATRLPSVVMQHMTAALAEPRLIYGCGPWRQVGETRVGPIARPVTANITAGTTGTVAVRAAAYNPDSDSLEVALVDAPDLGTSSLDTTSGDPVLAPPETLPNVSLFFPFAIRPEGVPARQSKGTVRVDVRAPSTGGGGSTPGVFDQTLPMGGLGVGLPCLYGGPGNVRISSFGIILMRAEHTGNINRICWQNRFDLSHGNTGYSTGEGGRIYWSVRKVTSAENVRPLVMGSVLGRTASINTPANIAPFQSAFAAAGGSGTVQENFARCPTIPLQSNVAVTAGDWLAFTQVQEDSAAGTVSTNNAYSTLRIQDNFSPYPYGEARHFANGSSTNQRPEHYPLFLYAYTDNFVCGNSHFFYANGVDADAILVPARGTRVRQLIPMPSWANGRTVKSVHVMAIRLDNTTSANFVCRVRKADGTADGLTVGTDQVAPGTLKVKSNIKQTSQTQDPTAFTRFDFPTTGSGLITIAGGTTYYIELSSDQSGSTTTRFQMDRMDRFFTFAPVGLRNASYMLSGMRGQRNTGGGWVDLTGGGRTHDVPVWVEFA